MKLICGCDTYTLTPCDTHASPSRNSIPSHPPLEIQDRPERLLPSPLRVQPRTGPAYEALNTLYNELHDYAADLGVIKDITPEDYREVAQKLIGIIESVAKAHRDYVAAIGHPLSLGENNERA